MVPRQAGKGDTGGQITVIIRSAGRVRPGPAMTIVLRIHAIIVRATAHLRASAGGIWKDLEKGIRPIGQVESLDGMRGSRGGKSRHNGR